MSKLEIGSRVTMYDRYRFAIPLEGTVKAFSDINDGVGVSLTQSNTVEYPIGAEVWVHRKQVVPVEDVEPEEQTIEECLLHLLDLVGIKPNE